MASPRIEPSADLDLLASEVVDAIGEVRAQLGVGLLEDCYAEAFAIELDLRGLRFVRNPKLALQYKGRPLKKRYHPDFIIEDAIVVEAKAVSELHPTHFAQLMTYLRHSRKGLGFLVNFHCVPLRNGIHRRVHSAWLA